MLKQCIISVFSAVIYAIPKYIESVTHMKLFISISLLVFHFNLIHAYGQTKHALLIAINQYEPPGGIPAGSHAGLRSGFSNLDGCINDAQAVKSLLLSRFAFREDKITEVYNQDATRKRIMDEVALLTDRVQSGDVVFIFYAGHGSQQPNSLSPEADKLDETLVPADAWKNPLSDIRDKEQRVWYNNLLKKGANVTVIFDCCHSGSMSRGGEPVYARPRFRKIEQNPNDAKDGSLPPDPVSIAGDRLLVISAAQDFELAAEATDSDGKPHGAFSLALMTAMAQVPSGMAAANIFTAIRSILKSNGVAQEPQIVGSDYRLKQNLLGVPGENLPNQTLVSLNKSSQDDRWEISGGSGLGIRKGNELAMIGDTGVVIKVDSVLGVAKSTVRLIKGDVARLEPGRFFELTNWVNEEKPLLTVYVPENSFDFKAVQTIAQRFSDIRSKSPGKWIDNLKKQVPDVSAWFYKGQMQMQVKGQLVPKADWKTLEVAVQKPDIKYAIFYLPVPVELKSGLEKHFQAGTSYQMTEDPGKAQYHVGGQAGKGGNPEYYLMNRASAAKDSLEALPNETNHHALTSASPEAITALSYQLFEYAVRIGRVRGWLQINGPAGNDFPFQLVVLNSKEQPAGTEGLKVGETATLKMVGTDAINNPNFTIRDKYLYAFAIDREGAMSLIYPEKGSGEVFPPRTVSGSIVSEFTFGSFNIVEPVGTDNFFVLAVKDPIPNPQSIFNQEGVFTSRNVNLSGLLDPLLNMGTRSVKLGRTETPADWNLLRLAIKSKH